MPPRSTYASKPRSLRIYAAAELRQAPERGHGVVGDFPGHGIGVLLLVFLRRTAD
jgi:hypothetical protein